MKKSNKPKILILGITGMLGSTLFRILSEGDEYEVYGTMRYTGRHQFFSSRLQERIIFGINVESETSLLSAFAISSPDIVINCVGIIKQLAESKDHLASLSINSILPHRLALFCQSSGSRLLHFSTDCVFSGRSGMYTEDDYPDCNDLYGRSKYLGEVKYENTLTLRTSIIGHELQSKNSLIDWFLSQRGVVTGFRKAIFSGLPTTEIARVLKKYVFPRQDLNGLVHLSVHPINKYELLKLVAETYGTPISLIASDTLEINRSLDSGKFRTITGFVPKPWPDLISEMHAEYLQSGNFLSK